MVQRSITSVLQRIAKRTAPLALVLIALSLHSTVANAASTSEQTRASHPTAREIEHLFEARYKHASTLKAVFYERYGSGKGTGEAESGTVYFSRPGRMRWEYESPQKKLFIVDGKNVWFYIPDDHTASRTTMKNSSDWRTPIALLAENADLAKVCRNVQLDTQHQTDASVAKGQTQSYEASRDRSGADQPVPAMTDEDSVLRCTPRAKSDENGQAITNVLLTIDPSGYLVRVLIQQAGDVNTEFRFGNWQVNVHIGEAMFHFAPPPGVEIVDEDKLAGQMQ